MAGWALSGRTKHWKCPERGHFQCLGEWLGCQTPRAHPDGCALGVRKERNDLTWRTRQTRHVLHVGEEGHVEHTQTGVFYMYKGRRIAFHDKHTQFGVFIVFGRRGITTNIMNTPKQRVHYVCCKRHVADAQMGICNVSGWWGRVPKHKNTPKWACLHVSAKGEGVSVVG